MKQKRLIALLLAAVMLVGLFAGCKKQESTDNKTDTKTPSSSSNTEKSAVTAKYAYKADYLELSEGFEYVNSSCFAGDSLYLTAMREGELKTEVDEEGNEYSYSEYENGLYRVDIATGECTRLESVSFDFKPEGWDQGSSDIGTMKAGPDGTLWMIVNTYAWRTNLPEDFDPENDEMWNYQENYDSACLLHLSQDGETLDTVKLYENINDANGEVVILEDSDAAAEPAPQASSLELPDDLRWISSFCIDSSGNLYLSNYENIYLFKADGSYIGKVAAQDGGGELRQLDQNRVGITTWKQSDNPDEGGTTWFVTLNPDLSWGDEFKLPMNAWSIFPGDDVYDLYYDYNGKIFGYTFENQQSEKVVDWMEADVDSNNLNSYSILPDGRVVAFSSIWDNQGSRMHTEMVVLTRVDASEIKEKTILTAACLYLDWDMRSRIVEYNKTNEQYRIVVRDYSELMDDSGSIDSAITKLNAELIGGNIPDIFLCNNLPIKKYAAKGFLADLYTLMDGSALTRDQFVPEVLSALESDGKLYQVPTAFTVTSAYGLTKIVGEYDTWNTANLQDAMTKLPEDATVFGVGRTKSEILSSCLYRNIAAYVDWESGKCSFDSQGFIDLLKFVDTFPAEFDWDAYYENQEEGPYMYESPTSVMMNGKQLLSEFSLYNFNDFVYTCYPIQNEITFVGYPSEDGSSRSSFNIQTSMAIAASSPHKEAAWDFVSSIILEQNKIEGSDTYFFGLPILQSSFDQIVERVSTEHEILDQDGNTVDWDEDGVPDLQQIGGYESYENGEYDWHPVYALDEQSVNMLLELIRSTTAVSDYDNEIITIILDECGAFFAGDTSAEDTARMIQSRVNLYVQEQR